MVTTRDLDLDSVAYMDPLFARCFTNTFVFVLRLCLVAFLRYHVKHVVYSREMEILQDKETSVLEAEDEQQV